MFDATTNDDQDLLFNAVLHRVSAADFYSTCKRRWESQPAVREKFRTAELYATHLVAQLLDVQSRAQAVAAANERQRSAQSS
jgi:hypothetical protein